jgi:DnaJ like chaperone protein
MGIAGKLIGGGLGWALMGPLGALIGSMIGNKFDQGAEQAAGPSSHGDFAAALMVLCARVIQADGRVSSAEIVHVRTFVSQTFPRHAQELMQLVQRLIKQQIDVQPICTQIAQNLNYYERLELIQLLAAIAHADGQLHPSEEQVIRQISSYLLVKPEDIAHILGASTAGDRRTNGSGSSMTKAYEVLGVDTNATNVELKDAYRKLAKNFHPDRVAHLGDDFRLFAEDKFKQLQGAWSEIRKERGI